MIVLDYETRSRCDLKECGAEVYVRDPSTDILCLALYDLDTDEHIVFDPIETDMPTGWRNKLLDRDRLIAAHNAAFDRGIHEIGVQEYGFPKIEFNRWYCTSAQMRVNALPAALEDAAIALGVTNKKDHKGSALIKKLSIPNKETGEFNEDPDLMLEMMDYCLKDVLATVDIMRKTRMLTQREHNDWLINERINQRGVRVDLYLANKAQAYAAEEQAGISAKLTELTDGAITKATQHQRIKAYVLDALDKTDENDRKLEKLMTVYKGKEKKYSLDKNVRESVITSIDTGNLELYEDIEELIRLLDDASMSSVAKFKRMVTRSNEDERVRGAFIYAGAGQTLRYSSKGLQMHNMKRKCFNETQTEDMLDIMEENKPLPNVMDTLSMLLRPAIIPNDGHVFVVNDWSAIEARALPWLTNDPLAEAKLDLFRNDVDVYVEAAKAMDIDDRQIGKVAELSLGYGGAVGAFMAMAKNYGLILPESQVKRIVKAWRKSNKWAVKYWATCEKAAKKAVRSKNRELFEAGRVKYQYIKELMGGTLLCHLPDGTTIQYPKCKIEYSDKGDNLTALKASIHPKAGEKEWGRVRLWGGLLVENITQAFCGGLLRDKLRVCDERGLNIVAHVHDEMIDECEEEWAKDVANELQAIMEEVPTYAKGLPLKAEPEIKFRYGK